MADQFPDARAAAAWNDFVAARLAADAAPKGSSAYIDLELNAVRAWQRLARAIGPAENDTPQRTRDAELALSEALSDAQACLHAVLCGGMLDHTDGSNPDDHSKAVRILHVANDVIVKALRAYEGEPA